MLDYLVVFVHRQKYEPSRNLLYRIVERSFGTVQRCVTFVEYRFNSVYS